MLSLYCMHNESFLAAHGADFRHFTAVRSEEDGIFTMSYSMFAFHYGHFFQQSLHNHSPFFTRSSRWLWLQMCYSLAALQNVFASWWVLAIREIDQYWWVSFSFYILTTAISHFVKQCHWCQFISNFSVRLEPLRLSIGGDQQVPFPSRISISWSWSELSCQALPYIPTFVKFQCWNVLCYSNVTFSTGVLTYDIFRLLRFASFCWFDIAVMWYWILKVCVLFFSLFFCIAFYLCSSYDQGRFNFIVVSVHRS